MPVSPSPSTGLSKRWYPPFLEERTHLRQQFRVMSELVRYHQTGRSSGWIEVDGERHEMNPETWVSTRDHSWGVRYDVGQPPPDVEPRPTIPPGIGFMMIWSPILMQRADGSHYALHLHFTRFEATGFQQKMVTARVEHPDGSSQIITDIDPCLEFDPQNRRLRGGRLDCKMEDGAGRSLEIEVLGDTGIHLGAGLYFGFDGHHHGEWRGPLHIEGEHIEDCTDPAQARRLHQIRDTPIRVHDRSTGDVGWGNCQPIAAGPWPKLGLDDDAWM